MQEEEEEAEVGVRQLEDQMFSAQKTCSESRTSRLKGWQMSGYGYHIICIIYDISSVNQHQNRQQISLSVFDFQWLVSVWTMKICSIKILYCVDVLYRQEFKD